MQKKKENAKENVKEKKRMQKREKKYIEYIDFILHKLTTYADSSTVCRT